jgi:hypothetical protein
MARFRCNACLAVYVGIPMKSAAYSDGSRPLIPIDVGHPLRGAPLGEDNVSHGFVCVNLRAQLAY